MSSTSELCLNFRRYVRVQLYISNTCINGVNTMFITNIYDYFVAHCKATKIMNELYSLSDRDLRELNITRAEIPSLAYDATKNRD